MRILRLPETWVILVALVAIIAILVHDFRQKHSVSIASKAGSPSAK